MSNDSLVAENTFGNVHRLALVRGHLHHPAMTRQDDEREQGEKKGEEEAGERDSSDRSASRDLAEGLEMMLRATRKALGRVDTRHIEDLGRRAASSLEQLDRAKVNELGRRAARSLDPRHLEEVAEDAGRELVNVVERVVSRLDNLVTRVRMSGDEKGPGPGPSAESATPPSEQGQAEPRTRVRVSSEGDN